MHTDWQTAAVFFAYGAVGGIVGAMSKSRRLRLPRVIRHVEKDGDLVVEVDAGFLLAPLLGGLVAMLLDGRPATAIGWGLACGYAGPAIVNVIVDGMLRKLGVETEEIVQSTAMETYRAETGAAGSRLERRAGVEAVDESRRRRKAGKDDGV